MSSMLGKGKKDKHEEEVQFSAYKQFCDDVSVQMANAIEEANGKHTVLKADVEKAVATLAKLTTEVAERGEDISTWNGDIKAATAVRNQKRPTTTRLMLIILSPSMLWKGQSPS